MHSHLTIHSADFPQLIPSNALTGDRIRLVVTGIVRRIEENLEHTSGDHSPRYVLADIEHELLIVEARITEPATTR